VSEETNAVISTGAAESETDLRASDGRIPGRRGLATRQKLLDATRAVLDTVAYRDLKVVDIARQAGTSPATFYQYFPDVESVMLTLAGNLSEAWHSDLRQLVTNRDWDTDPDGAAHVVADGMLEFWTRHKPVLRVLDLTSMEGDLRFREIRSFLWPAPRPPSWTWRPNGRLRATRWPQPVSWLECWPTSPTTSMAWSGGVSPTNSWSTRSPASSGERSWAWPERPTPVPMVGIVAAASPVASAR